MYGLEFIEASNCVDLEVIGARAKGWQRQNNALFQDMMMMKVMIIIIITSYYYRVEAYLKTLKFLKGSPRLSLVIYSRDQSPKQWTSTVLVSPRFTGYHGMQPAI